MADSEADLLALIPAARAGEREAQDALVLRVHDRVRAIVHRELEGRFRAQHRWILPLFSTSDVVQDVLTDAIRNLEDTDFPAEGAFVRYLATIVRNNLLSAVRFHESKRRDLRRRVDAPRAAEPTAPTLDGPPLAAALSEQASAVRAVLDGFPPRHRALLELRLMENKTFPEIAGELGYASAETARQALCEAQAKLVLRLRAAGIRPQGGTRD